jgi:hypothetical protein
MNLISCDNCGVVLDVGKLDFPQGLDPSHPPDVDELFAWDKDRGEWVPTVHCPVCDEKILAPDP